MGTLSQLAPYAALPEHSRGRVFAQAEHCYRNCYERDCDRIVHSRAFRRLEYKTQVFPNYEGDHFRTRLTHTIEVAQLARTVARVLRLNPTLSEAIALAHDLGHPPFGHVGEETLDTLLADNGGFEHNRQSLRIIDQLEERYAEFPGLNLTYEVREGIAKHSTRYDRYNPEELDTFDVLDRPVLEAQLVEWVDTIAYNVHDIDDGVEAHILSIEDLASRVPLFARVLHQSSIALPEATGRQLFNETIRRLLDLLVTDLVDATRERLEMAEIRTVSDVRRHGSNLVGHSKAVTGELSGLSRYLDQELYQSDRVARAMTQARAAIQTIFSAYRNHPDLLPPRHRARCTRIGALTAITDYVAGMTDRFALKQEERVRRATTT